MTENIQVGDVFVQSNKSKLSEVENTVNRLLKKWNKYLLEKRKQDILNGSSYTG